MSVYGELTQVAHAARGRFTASVFVDNEGILLFRITPGVRLSERQFDLWFPDFSIPFLDIDTASVSMYEHKETTDHSMEELKEYFQKQVEKMVSHLDGVDTGTLFT